MEVKNGLGKSNNVIYIFFVRRAKNVSEICPISAPSREAARRKTERKNENIVACCLSWTKSELFSAKIPTPTFRKNYARARRNSSPSPLSSAAPSLPRRANFL
ncbi:MAG: hypothetical protein COS26_02705 [Candidatus Nealsonbacteria bacterium CG02_land_8_20_14_3_00_40_11]|uniref:Uncharacterized protein n=1 Tax=Candidatus Nealsonbacteria bacterium CG02_land_8_20_14_3_00_40_11 TaxID=1974700 RepID=A0A2M7D7B6_9BACT|nr:MAG: hypothetical protein COS26_02705 [Candidatus Nealsonbacteria bacterium CG02_land_8_20_14_3_00_40_11]